MHFDPTITTGNLLTILTLLISGLSVIWQAAKRDVLAQARLATIELLLTKQDERLAKAEDALMAYSLTLARITGFCESQHAKEGQHVAPYGLGGG